MSGFSILQDTTLELRRQILTALDRTPDTDFNLGDSIDRLFLGPPPDQPGESVFATLFLYHIDLDKHLRNQRLLPDRDDPDSLKRPPLPLQLRYLFTPVDEDEAQNQLVLGRVLQHFHDEPMITSVMSTPLTDSFGGASPTLRVKPDMLSLEQLSQIWNALAGSYRLSISFLVEIVAVDSGEPSLAVPRVREMAPAAGLREDDR